MKKIWMTLCLLVGIVSSALAGADIEDEIGVEGGAATVPYVVDTVAKILTINPAYEIVGGERKDYEQPVSLIPSAGGTFSWSRVPWTKGIRTIVFNCDIDTIGCKAFVDLPNVSTLIFTSKVTHLRMIHENSFLTLYELGESSTLDFSKLESVLFMGQKNPPKFGLSDYSECHHRDSLALFWKQRFVINVYVPGDMDLLEFSAPIDMYKAAYVWKESEYFAIFSLPGSLIKEDGTISEEGTVDVTWYPVETATEYHLSIKDDMLVTLLDTVIHANGTTGEVVLNVEKLPARVRKVILGDQTMITIVITINTGSAEGMASATATVGGLDPNSSYRVTLDAYAASDEPGGDNQLISSSSVDYGEISDLPSAIGVSIITIPDGVMYDMMGRPANGGHGIRIYRSGDKVKKILL